MVKAVMAAKVAAHLAKTAHNWLKAPLPKPVRKKMATAMKADVAVAAEAIATTANVP
jgi:hypothetical protein